MPGKTRRVYWDANLFLSYINGYADRLPTLEALIVTLRKTDDLVAVTSTLSITEVAFGQDEQGIENLDPAVLTRIDEMWDDVSLVTLIDVFPTIAYNARMLMRGAKARGWSLKAPDAIHFATAQLVAVEEFLTYDARLYRFEPYVGFPVREPYSPQLALPLDAAP